MRSRFFALTAAFVALLLGVWMLTSRLAESLPTSSPLPETSVSDGAGAPVFDVPEVSTPIPQAPVALPVTTTPQTGIVVGLSRLVAIDAFSRMNDERRAAGLRELIEDQTLTTASEDWAQTMTTRGYNHSSDRRLASVVGKDSAGAVSENIHAPERQCVASSPCTDLANQPTSGVLNVDWMNSALHRTAILGPNWDRAGVGVFCTADGRMWAVMLFASPKGVQADLPTSTSYRPPARPTNDGMTCTGQSREHNTLWQHTPPS